MTAAHMGAVLQLLEEFPHTLYVGQVPDQPSFPYAVIYMDTGRGGDLRLSGHTRRRTFDFQITSVGLTDTAVRIVADAASDLLLDRRPRVPGYSSGRIRHVTSVPVRPDTDVRDTETRLHPMFSVDTYSFRSTPRESQ